MKDSQKLTEVLFEVFFLAQNGFYIFHKEGCAESS